MGAFGVVGVVERATGSDKMDSFLGLHKRNPVLAAVLLVLFLSLAGIPPLVGFWAKFNLFAAVLGVSAGPVPFALVALAVALSAVSLYYYLQVLKRAYVMQGVDDTPIKAAPRDHGCAGIDCGCCRDIGLLSGGALRGGSTASYINDKSGQYPPSKLSVATLFKIKIIFIPSKRFSKLLDQWS